MEKIRVNSALTEMALAFSEQPPLGGAAGTVLFREGDLIPPGVEYLGEGKVRVNFLAPKAETVSIMGFTGETPMEKQPNGVWMTVLEGRKGLSPLMFLVDGNMVLNPLAPIGFGASSPSNMMDVPEAGVDFFYCKEVPHGSVTQEVYWSKTLGEWESCIVYTPPGYMREPKDYPVLYLQHGHGENERCWTYQGKINFIMDNLIAEGKAEPCIIVMNNGMVQTTEDGKRVVRSILLEQLLVNDCIPYIERTYRVKTDRESRAMAGLSMGSMQTSMITMRHPELFAWVGVFSGFVRALPGLGGNDEHLQALDNAVKFTSDYKVFFRAIGSKDPFMQHFNDDSALLEEKGLSPEKSQSHRIKVYDGSHEWNVWRQCARDFLQMIFK